MTTVKDLAPANTRTIDQFAQRLGVSRGTLNNMRKRPEANMPQPLPTGLRKVLFRDTDVDAYVRYGATWNVR